ncbi:MAG TPA: DinB family protein [Terriglobia bacterium]|nr:DinB family protein [Terriglobia bacterium]
MAIKDAFIPEFDHEMASTRKTLERVPEDKFGWKPHEKSTTLGQLASHVAQLPSFATTALTTESLDIAPPGGSQRQRLNASTRQQLLEAFDKNVAEARTAIASASDEALHKTWSLLQGGKATVSLPRAAVLRTFMLNHLIHHRAQLGVYLRLNDVPVPSIYGPSADENPF